jgi:hypothetical protein
MSEGDPTFRIADGLDQVRIWELVERRVTLTVECVGCCRTTSWPPELIRRRLRANLANRLVGVAGRFRCAACRSPFVRISRERQITDADGRLVDATRRPDPAAKRGFTAANLDPNARRRW